MPEEAKRVLIADHHADFAAQLKRMLEACGLKAEVRGDAVSGGGGVAVLKPDAAVVDLDLPAGGGKIVYRVLRTNEQSRDIPVVVLLPPGPRKAWEELGCAPHPRTLVLRRALDLKLLVPSLKALLGVA